MLRLNWRFLQQVLDNKGSFISISSILFRSFYLVRVHKPFFWVFLIPIIFPLIVPVWIIACISFNAILESEWVVSVVIKLSPSKGTKNFIKTAKISSYTCMYPSPGSSSENTPIVNVQFKVVKITNGCWKENRILRQPRDSGVLYFWNFLWSSPASHNTYTWE